MIQNSVNQLLGIGAIAGKLNASQLEKDIGVQIGNLSDATEWEAYENSKGHFGTDENPIPAHKAVDKETGKTLKLKESLERNENTGNKIKDAFNRRYNKFYEPQRAQLESAMDQSALAKEKARDSWIEKAGQKAEQANNNHMTITLGGQKIPEDSPMYAMAMAAMTKEDEKDKEKK